MKSHIGVVAAIAVLAGCAGFIEAQPTPPPRRTVTVSLSAKDTAGAAIGNVPLCRNEFTQVVKTAQGCFVLLSPQGTGSVQVSCGDDETSFGVGLSARIDPANPRASEIPDGEAKVNELISQFAFLQQYGAARAASQTSVALPLVVRPATKTLVSVTADGFPVSGPAPIIHAVGYLGSAAKVTGAGKYEVSGVPSGVGYELYILDGDRLEFRTVAAHTQPFTLPTVAIDSAGASTSLHATLSRPAGTANASGVTGNLVAITLIRTDGSGGYVFYRGDYVSMPGADGHKQFAGGGPETSWKPNIKPGEYWVLPRPWGGKPKEVAFRQMLVAGRSVTGAGLPKVTAVAGQPVEIVLDGDAMEQTFDAFTKPLVEGALAGAWAESAQLCSDLVMAETRTVELLDARVMKVRFKCTPQPPICSPRNVRALSTSIWAVAAM